MSGTPAFGPYTTLRKIGDGGMGAVFEARHASLGKRVALKVLLPSMASNADVSARFVREGQAAARIRHPHVVDVYDVGTSPAGTYLVMELLEGEDLGQRLLQRERLPVEEALSILMPVFSAVAAAHREGVIHRDLKPSNIFLARDSIGRLQPKVVDFGISKIVETPDALALTKSAAVLGSPYYMAPEQVQSIKNTDARSDQYALAVILFECLTGRPPFIADSLYELLLAITSQETPAAASVAPVPVAVSDLILRAMARDPAARFESVRAFGRALLPFADTLTQTLWAQEFMDAPPPHASAELSDPCVERDATASPGLHPTPAQGASASGAGSLLQPGLARAGSSHSVTPSRKLALVTVVVMVAALAAGVFLATRQSASQPILAPSDSAVVAVAVPGPNDRNAYEVSLPVATQMPSATATLAAVPTLGSTGPSSRPPRPPPRAGKAPAREVRPPDRPVRGANSAWIVR